MTKYYVTHAAQPNEDYDVHRQDYNLLAFALSKTDLGCHATYHLAVVEAQKTYKKTSGCIRCFRARRTS